MTDDEALAQMNSGGDEAELAKLNGAHASSPATAPAPPERSFWQKAASTLGLDGPADQQIPQRLMAAQNGATAGLAPKINAAGEMGLKTVLHGVAPDSFEDPKWKDILAKNQDLYKNASEAHPTTDLAGSVLTPMPAMKGVGLAEGAARMGGASALQSAAKVYGQSPENSPTRALAGHEGEISLSTLLGGGLGALGSGLGSLAQRGEQKTAGAIAKNSEQVEQAGEDANRSAGRGVGGVKNDIFTTIEKAKVASQNPHLDWEERVANEKLLGSPEIRALQMEAAKLNRTRAGGLGSDLERANAERDEVASRFSPENVEKMKEEKLNKPEMAGGLWEIAKRMAPGVGGYVLDKALGGEGAIGGGLGMLAGAVGGQKGRILMNRSRTPAFQKSLGEAMSGVGHGGEGLASSSLSPREAKSLAEYMQQLKDEKDQAEYEKTLKGGK